MFKCKSLEATYMVDALREAFGEPAVRELPYVEVERRACVLHVDVAPLGHPQLWRRLLFCDLAEALKLCTKESLQILRVTLQISDRNVDSYQFKTAAKVVSVIGDDDASLIALCSDGSEHVVGSDAGNRKDIPGSKTVWSAAVAEAE